MTEAERNAAAVQLAEAEPAAVADAALGGTDAYSPVLRALLLSANHLPYGQTTELEISTDLNEQEAARTKSISMLANLLLFRWHLLRKTESLEQGTAYVFVNNKPIRIEPKAAGNIAALNRDELAGNNAKQICSLLASIHAPDNERLSLLALVAATMPVRVEPDKRKETRLLPVVRIRETRQERQAAMLFSAMAETRKELKLPLFEEAGVQIESWQPRRSVPLLDLADAHGVPIMAQGRGAPLALRFLIRALLAVQPDDRKRDYVELPLKVGELLNGLWPRLRRGKHKGKLGYRTGRDWPKLLKVLTQADSLFITLPDGTTQRIITLERLPPKRYAANGRELLPELNDIVLFTLRRLPGASTGPVIPLRTLDELGVDNSPRYRAWIAAQSLTWQPGKTRVRVPRKRLWTWTRREAAYPVLPAAERRELAFGRNDRKYRSPTAQEAAWEDLPGFAVAEQAIDPETGELGWRILPSEAARKLQELQELEPA